MQNVTNANHSGVKFNTAFDLNTKKIVRNSVSFTGVTEVFQKRFIQTQKEIADVFAKHPEDDGIAGSLPANWLAKIADKSKEEQSFIVAKIFKAFRAAIKHFRPYNAPKKTKSSYSQHKANLENKRIKEASVFLTKALRHFGILSEENSVNFKRRKVHGNYINRGYVLKERGKNPSLEKLFIKIFKNLDPRRPDANFNGKDAETAHWLYLNQIKCKNISKIYWGDTKGAYIATEYETPPKHSSPIVQLKQSYKSLGDFGIDFERQTGLSLEDLLNRGIVPGKIDRKGRFVPKSKEDLIMGYLHRELNDAGLMHSDLHKDNAVIGTDENGKPIVKIIDIGGLMKNISE